MTERELLLTLKATTPLFLAGADSRTLEVRGASVRGELRFWLRAMMGASNPDLEAVRKTEAAVFGSSNASSAVSLLFMPVGEPGTGDRFLLPHRQGTERSPAKAYVEDNHFQLCLRPAAGHTDLPREALAALLLWLNLGGLGKRSRRGFGCFQVVEVASKNLRLPNDMVALKPVLSNGDDLAKHLRQVMQWAVQTPAPQSEQRPEFPALARGYSKVLVCKKAFTSEPPYTRAMLDFWQKLRSPNLEDEYAYGYVKGQRRRASPVLLHIVHTNAGDHVVLSAFWSEPSPDRKTPEQGWKKVQGLLDECAKAWDGEYVWR